MAVSTFGPVRGLPDARFSRGRGMRGLVLPPQHLMLSGCSTQLPCSCRAARAWRLSAPRHASRTVRTQARYAPPSDDIPGPGDMYGMRPSGLATPREVLPSRELVEIGTKLTRNPSWYIISISMWSVRRMRRRSCLWRTCIL